MTLERQNGFLWIFGNFGLRNTFQEQIASKSIEIDMENLRMKFSALNVDFYSPSFDFIGSWKPAHEGIKEQYPHKSRYFIIFGQSFMKTVVDHDGHAAYHNKY